MYLACTSVSLCLELLLQHLPEHTLIERALNRLSQLQHRTLACLEPLGVSKSPDALPVSGVNKQILEESILHLVLFPKD